MSVIEEALQRWTAAGVLDQAAAERIRVFEAGRDHPTGLRWQVLLALIFGAILLAAGISLFVAAHWDELSPPMRFILVMGMLIVLHLGGIFARSRFDRLAVVLHGVATAVAGAAIALVGQIFNIQEHWPAAILLWALCALAGWLLLNDQVQQTATLLLFPAWIVCEWWASSDGYSNGELFSARMIAVFAAAYLTGFLSEKKKLVFGVLFAASSVTLIVSTAFLIDSSSYGWRKDTAMPTYLLVLAWLCIAVLPLAFAWRFNRPSVLPVLVVLLTVAVLPHLQQKGTSTSGLAAYGLVALVSAFFGWWGVQQRSRAMINYGVACFALVVLWFYFSSVMGKLERSFSLMLLGVLFLGGGWLLEKTRRRLVHHIAEAA